jgi:hypothetical protein
LWGAIVEVLLGRSTPTPPKNFSAKEQKAVYRLRDKFRGCAEAQRLAEEMRGRDREGASWKKHPHSPEELSNKKQERPTDYIPVFRRPPFLFPD